MALDVDEKRLIEDAKSSPLAFGKLYDLYYPIISNYLLHRMLHADLAQDITSEVFFKAMTRLNTFSWRGISFLPGFIRLPIMKLKCTTGREIGRISL
jgi:RNA polymerase sigma-70 factor (ECF subfamily)